MAYCIGNYDALMCRGGKTLYSCYNFYYNYNIAIKNFIKYY